MVPREERAWRSLRFCDALVLRRDVADELPFTVLLRQLQELLTPLADCPAMVSLRAA